MMDSSRRTLLAGLGSITLASRLRAAVPRPIRLGGPIFLKSDDPWELARGHRRPVYGAAYCPAATDAATARIREIDEAFADQNVVIAQVGACRNVHAPYDAKR